MPIEGTKKLIAGIGIMQVKSPLRKEGRFDVQLENITTNDYVVTKQIFPGSGNGIMIF